MVYIDNIYIYIFLWNTTESDREGGHLRSGESKVFTHFRDYKVIFFGGGIGWDNFNIII